MFDKLPCDCSGLGEATAAEGRGGEREGRCRKKRELDCEQKKNKIEATVASGP